MWCNKRIVLFTIAVKMNRVRIRKNLTDPNTIKKTSVRMLKFSQSLITYLFHLLLLPFPCLSSPVLEIWPESWSCMRYPAASIAYPDPVLERRSGCVCLKKSASKAEIYRDREVGRKYIITWSLFLATFLLANLKFCKYIIRWSLFLAIFH